MCGRTMRESVMNKTIALFIVLFALSIGSASAAKITTDPNTPGSKASAASDDSAADKRLAQKVTYKVKLHQVSDIADDLTKLTGIKFLAGKNSSDWRVREDKMNIIAADIPLASLMNSMAHVMKFKWVKGGKSPEWTYRMVEDKKAIDAVLQRIEDAKNAGRKLRQSYLKQLVKFNNMSPDELAKLREEDPINYIGIKTGAAAATLQFFNEAPEIKQAWLEGRELIISASQLTPAARAAFIDAVIKSPYNSFPIFKDDVNQAERVRQLREAIDTGFDRDKINVSGSQGIGSIYSTYGGLSLKTAPKLKSGLLSAKAALKAYEENRIFMDIMKEIKGDIVQARASEAKSASCPPEDDSLLGHPDDPALHQGIKDKIDAKVITGLVESLGKVSGYAVITDNFKGRRPFTSPKDTELQKVLDQIGEDHYYNWDLRSGVIEMWSRRWYDGRDRRVSLAWLERLKNTFKTTGTLDIDDLAEIAQLKDSQFWNVCSESLLRPAYYCIQYHRDYLKFFITLNSTQRALLFSEPGLAFTSLTPDQQQSVLKIASGKDTSALGEGALPDIGLRISASRVQDGKRYIYILRVFTRFGQIPGEYKFRTPICPQLEPEPDRGQAAPG